MTRNTILIVEDNPDDEALARAALARIPMRHEIVVAHDGAEAVDYLHGTGPFADRPSFELPAVVLLDLRMPKMDGFEVLRRLRGNPCTEVLPIVVLTSSNLEEDVYEAYRLGANSYIRKPVDFAEFRDGMQQVVTYWLRWNELPPAAKPVREPRRLPQGFGGY